MTTHQRYIVRIIIGVILLMMGGGCTTIVAFFLVETFEARATLSSLAESNVSGEIWWRQSTEPNGYSLHIHLVGLQPKSNYFIQFRHGASCGTDLQYNWVIPTAPTVISPADPHYIGGIVYVEPPSQLISDSDGIIDQVVDVDGHGLLFRNPLIYVGIYEKTFKNSSVASSKFLACGRFLERKVKDPLIPIHT